MDQDPAPPTEGTLHGSLVCNGACLPDPKPEDHVLMLFAIDGMPAIRAEMKAILTETWPDRGLDADAARKLMDQFSARLKYFISTDSTAPEAATKRANHYCAAAAARVVTGTVREKDGRKWITAVKIEPAALHYPDRMLAPDTPFVKPDEKPVYHPPLPGNARGLRA
jgi:hypothetical protein